MDLSPIQLAASASGAIAGVGAIAVSWRRRWAAPDTAAALAAIVLANTDQASYLLPVGVAALWIAPFLGRIRRVGPPAGIGASILGIVFALMALTNPTVGAIALLAITLPLAVVPLWLPAPEGSAGLLAVAIGGAMVATALGGPDTEGAYTAFAALIPPLAVAGRARPIAGIGAAAVVLAAFVAVDAYRGRPGGLAAAATALALIVMGACLARVPQGRWPWVAAGLGACLAIACARVIGLGASVGTVDLAVATIASVAMLAVGAVALSVERPAPARTPQG